MNQPFLPKLVVRYPTDPAGIDALLPPGFSRWGDPMVQIGVYCVPVHGEPEHGISIKVPATFEGEDGWYTLGIGIDQESAIFISQETNGQPKFPCDVTYFRIGDVVEARAVHQGTTFFEYRGTAGEDTTPADASETQETEWWTKYSRAVGGAGGFDLEPRVVAVRTSGVPVRCTPIDGQLTLRQSPWDPVTHYLPATGPAHAELVTVQHTGRNISVAGLLAADAFEPFADTIGGSRWPGERGAPKPLEPR
ncbi:MAG: acetoacetate decarboxylase family protein [Actinomycetes bacterium]